MDGFRRSENGLQAAGDGQRASIRDSGDGMLGSTFAALLRLAVAGGALISAWPSTSAMLPAMLADRVRAGRRAASISTLPGGTQQHFKQ
eukprot:365707-Chlamydomonas_euryale.AAC.31